MKIDEATVYHQGRADYKRYLDCHVILIKPDNGKSIIKAYYHPQVPNAGWAKVVLTIMKIPVVGKYTMNAVIKE